VAQQGIFGGEDIHDTHMLEKSMSIMSPIHHEILPHIIFVGPVFFFLGGGYDILASFHCFSYLWFFFPLSLFWPLLLGLLQKNLTV